MKKLLTLYLLGLLILSCKKNEKADLKVKDSNFDSIEKTSSSVSDLKLDVFKTIPDSLYGCGEYFTLENEKDESVNYIFISNLTDFAIIKVKNKNIFLEKDTLKSKESSNGIFNEEYSGNGYKAILKTKLIKEYDEGGLYKGTLKILKNNKEKVFNIKGESGC